MRCQQIVSEVELNILMTKWDIEDYYYQKLKSSPFNQSKNCRSTIKRVGQTVKNNPSLCFNARLSGYLFNHFEFYFSEIAAVISFPDWILIRAEEAVCLYKLASLLELKANLRRCTFGTLYRLLPQPDYAVKVC